MAKRIEEVHQRRMMHKERDESEPRQDAMNMSKTFANRTWFNGFWTLATRCKSGGDTAKGFRFGTKTTAPSNISRVTPWTATLSVPQLPKGINAIIAVTLTQEPIRAYFPRSTLPNNYVLIHAIPVETHSLTDLLLRI